MSLRGTGPAVLAHATPVGLAGGETTGLTVLEPLASDPVLGSAPQPAVTKSTAATKNQPARRMSTFLNEAWEACVTSARAYGKQLLNGRA